MTTNQKVTQKVKNASLVFVTAIITSLVTVLIILTLTESSIPISDVAAMKINENGYYEITIKDISNIGDSKYGKSYDSIMKEVNAIN